MSSSTYAYPPEEKATIEAPLTDRDYLKIKKAALVLRAINHKLRQKIVQTIYEHKRISVTDLYMELGLEQSVASQHLAILRKSNIVNTGREGKFIFYTVNLDRIEEITAFINNLVG